jgi:uncharacterized protein
MDREELVLDGTTALTGRHRRDRSGAPVDARRSVAPLAATARAVRIVVALALGTAFLTACASQERTVKVIGRPGTVAAAAGAQRPSANVSDEPSATIDPNRPSGIDAAADVSALTSRFSTVAVTITRADGSQLQWCLFLADTDELRQRGLQTVTELGGYEGMLFRFGQEQATPFWMKGTLLPLSIAFFGSDGSLLSARDMDPCPDEVSAACPTYPAEVRYADAIETIIGGLTDAGVVAGSKLAVGQPGCRPNR